MYQCKSCGGFCSKGGCDRLDVEKKSVDAALAKKMSYLDIQISISERNERLEAEIASMKQDIERQLKKIAEYEEENARLKDDIEISKEIRRAAFADGFKFGVNETTMQKDKRIFELLDDIDKLRGFALSIMAAWPDAGLDGWEIQDLAIEFRLLEGSEISAACGSENCECEPGDICYTPTKLLRRY